MLLTKLKVLTAVAAAGLVALPVVWAQVPAPAPVPPPRVAGAEKPVPSPPDRPVGLPADWTMVKELPLIVDPLGGPGAAAERLALRVEQGWLVVRLETTTGHLQWEVVLARATDPTPPAVEADPKFRGIYVQYGPYLVRENLGRLRVYRERKTPDSAAWPIPKAVAGEQFDSKCGTIDVTLAGDWYWLTAGAIADKPDVRVRFQHKDLLGDGKGVQSFRAFKENLNYVTFGKNAVCYDEGDLLHGFRIPPYNAVNDIAWEKMKVEFGTKPPPALDGKTWFNTPAPLSLDGLKGKVVLLDFWGQWCLPCVKNLPKVGELHTKYKDRGLVVIGVHSQDQSEKLDEFLTEKKVPFPVLIDSGKTAAQYPIGGWPTYFLLDKAGNVVYGPSNDPPSEAEVEKQLAK